MKITFLTTVLAMLFTLPAFGFSVGDLLNIQKKSDEPQNPVSTNQPVSASESASDAAVSESAKSGQQGLSKGISGQTQTNLGGSDPHNVDSPSNPEATGRGCPKNDQGEFLC